MLDRKNALLASKTADDHRNHLRDADTDIARRALFEIAQGNHLASARTFGQMMRDRFLRGGLP